jgi:hypothetical protein
MVAPLLAVLGTGLQMYGADEQAGAQGVADYTGRINSRLIGEGQVADQRLTNQILGNLGEQHFASGEQAVDDSSAANQRGAFYGAADELGTQIDAVQAQPGSIDPMVAAGAENIAFQRALAGQKASNDIRTEQLNKVLENNAGLDAKDRLLHDSMADKSDRDQMIRQRIMDVQRLQNYADGIRRAALQRTGAQHSLDSASAASTGSGAMYLGALMQAGAVLANRPPTPAPGGPGNTGTPGYSPTNQTAYGTPASTPGSNPWDYATPGTLPGHYNIPAPGSSPTDYLR